MITEILLHMDVVSLALFCAGIGMVVTGLIMLVRLLIRLLLAHMQPRRQRDRGPQ